VSAEFYVLRKGNATLSISIFCNRFNFQSGSIYRGMYQVIIFCRNNTTLFLQKPEVFIKFLCVFDCITFDIFM
jgi:hypothetical protein